MAPSPSQPNKADDLRRYEEIARAQDEALATEKAVERLRGAAEDPFAMGAGTASDVRRVGTALTEAKARIEYLERGWAEGFVPRSDLTEAQDKVARLGRAIERGITMADNQAESETGRAHDLMRIVAATLRAALTEQEDTDG